MTILQPLIDSTKFEHTKTLWQEGVAQDAFELFFSCILANMSRQIHYLQYQQFVNDTHDAFLMSKDGGYVAPTLLVFWDNPSHAKLRQKIAETVLVNSDELSTPLVLGLHAAMAELKELAAAQTQTVPEWINGRMGAIAALLPSWADMVVDKAVLARLHVDQILNPAMQPSLLGAHQQPDIISHTTSHHTKDATQGNQSQVVQDDQSQALKGLRHTKVDGMDISGMGRLRKTPKRQGRSWFVAVPMLVALIAMGVGGYYYLKRAVPPAEQSPTLAVQSLPPSQLSITIKGKGELYACHAKLGSSQLSQELVSVIQANFAHTLCIIDVDENLSKELPLEKLASVLALLQTAPYATFELIGDKAYINAPSGSDVSRLVADIGALMPSIQVMPMPALNADAAIQSSIQAATDALNALPANPDDFALARAMSLQLIDTAKGGVPEINQAVLKLAGERLKTSGNTRLIIVAHSDESGDRALLRTQSQIVADAIKNALVGYGASDGQLTAIGVGADFPLADNQTDIGRFKNRRVEFLVYDEATVQALSQPATTEIASSEDDLPIFEVVDGQIVQKDPNAVDQVPDVPSVGVETPLPSTPSMPALNPPINPTPVAPPPTYIPPPSPTAPAGGGIDEDLLRPLEAEPFAKGTAVQLQP